MPFGSPQRRFPLFAICRTLIGRIQRYLGGRSRASEIPSQGQSQHKDLGHPTCRRNRSHAFQRVITRPNLHTILHRAPAFATRSRTMSHGLGSAFSAPCGTGRRETTLTTESLADPTASINRTRRELENVRNDGSCRGIDTTGAVPRATGNR